MTGCIGGGPGVFMSAPSRTRPLAGTRSTGRSRRDRRLPRSGGARSGVLWLLTAWVLPELPVRHRGRRGRGRTGWFEPHRIWILDVNHFTPGQRAEFAIIDMVSRSWIASVAAPRRPPHRSSWSSKPRLRQRSPGAVDR